jgi:hypothetical protein
MFSWRGSRQHLRPGQRHAILRRPPLAELKGFVLAVDCRGPRCSGIQSKGAGEPSLEKLLRLSSIASAIPCGCLPRRYHLLLARRLVSRSLFKLTLRFHCERSEAISPGLLRFARNDNRKAWPLRPKPSPAEAWSKSLLDLFGAVRHRVARRTDVLTNTGGGIAGAEHGNRTKHRHYQQRAEKASAQKSELVHVRYPVAD